MGEDATCDVRRGRKRETVKVHLEPNELRIGGSLAERIPIGAIKSSEAKGGELTVVWTGGKAVLALGKDAEKWALKIRYPKSRLDKLGIKPGLRVAVVGLDDPAFRKELAERTKDVTEGGPRAETDVVVVAMTKPADLARLKNLRESIKKNGAIWVVWPKGRKEFREDDVRAFGPKAGLVDVKVMAFSDTLSGLKMVIPVKER
jgi:hypothetical protein